MSSIDKMDLDTHCTKCPDMTMFQASHAKTTRGHAMKLQVHQATGVRSRFFSTRAIKIWNSLPESVISVSSVNELKQVLKNDPFEKSLHYDIDLRV